MRAAGGSLPAICQNGVSALRHVLEMYMIPYAVWPSQTVDIECSGLTRINLESHAVLLAAPKHDYRRSPVCKCI